MTPIAVFGSSVLSMILKDGTKFIVEAYFDAMAAGTFLYIAFFCKDQDICEKTSTKLTFFKSGLFFIGVSFMAILANWI